MYVSAKGALVLRNHRDGEEGICCKSKDPPLQHLLGLEGQVGVHGYEGKATEITKDTWDGLIAFWKLPSSIRKAKSCSASGRTKDRDGHLPMVHRTRKKSHAEIRLEAVSFICNNYFYFFKLILIN